MGEKSTQIKRKKKKKVRELARAKANVRLGL